MKLWSYIKDAMLENHNQIISEGRAEMTYEEAAIYAELFSKKLYGLKSCAILCGSEMAGAQLFCRRSDSRSAFGKIRQGTQRQNS